MLTIATTNHGSLIVSSTYWGSDAETAGKIWVSCNAGTIRVLMPRTARAAIEDMRAAKYVICSRGPWPEQKLDSAVELLFEDDSDSPFVLHLSPESFDALPAEPPPDRAWLLAVWDLKKGKPHRAVERPCFWRRVPEIPWLKPL